MKFITIIAALLWALGAGRAEAKLWAIDPAASKLTFSGTQTGTAFTGAFGSYTAVIDLDPADTKTAKINVTIEMASAKTGDVQRDGALPGKDWFDVATHKQASFVSTEVTKKDETNFEAKGTLTIKGVAQPVVLPFTLTPEVKGLRAKGAITIDRTAYNVGTGEWLSDAYVAKPVTITVDVLGN